MSNFQIRKATPEDTPTIFNLIYKLAVYEKLENDVITTVEFNNLESCKSAYSYFVKDLPPNQGMRGVCVPKGENK